MVERLSPTDASFLHMDDDVNQVQIASVAVFEGPPPAYADVLAMIQGKLPLVRRYRQVVRFVPFDLGRPVWTDDPHFNLEYHIRHTALPAPGGEAELRRLVGRVMSQHLDRNKPLWEMWMVEGLEDERWALISKVHHSMVDGVAGSDLMSVMFDLSPDPTERVPDYWRPQAAPSSVALAVGAVAEMARSPYEQLRALQASVRVPREAGRQVVDILQGATSLIGLVRPAPSSSLNGPIGPHRRFAWVSATVEDAKTIRKAWGGTFNDVVLAAITVGFRDLLLSRGESVDRVVRTMVPVSVRPRDVSGKAAGDGTLANKVSSMFADLPVGLNDPRERLAAITAQMDKLKESNQAVAAEALTSMSGFAPPALLALATRLAARLPQRNINTVTSNVPGPQFPLYVAGKRMLAVYPYALAINTVRVSVAIYSYNGGVNFGITGDYDSMPDIDVLAAGIKRGMDEMVKLSA